ncbi:putative transcriptional regulator, Crp/Fnr family protein [Calothrix sp. NIES-4101]|nr:putative transcriptional regulator, Crp/Fnr family protein [Calothrix sp. NIES-4101]
MKYSTNKSIIGELKLAPLSHNKIFPRRSYLPLEENYLWKIDKGVVRTLTWLEDGTIVTLGLWGEGDIVGRKLSKTEAFEIECLTKVEVTAIYLHDVLSMPEVLLEHIQQSEDLTIIRSYRTVDLIIIKLLAWLAKKFGHAVENGHLIDLRLTHQDIAEIAGSTRVTVTRILSQLEEQGIIQRLPMHMTLVQVQELWHYEI